MDDPSPSVYLKRYKEKRGILKHQEITHQGEVIILARISHQPPTATAPEHLEKISKSLRAFVNEHAQQLGDKSEHFYNAASAYIADAHNKIMKKGHTVGVAVEIRGSVGLAVAGELIDFKGLRDGLQGQCILFFNLGSNSSNA